MGPEEYLHDAEGFTRSLSAEQYVARSGLKATLDLAPIYERYPHLFEGDRFAEASRWDIDPRQLHHLLDFIAHGYAEDQSRDSAERAAAMETSLTVDWDEAPVPYRQVPALIAGEANAVRRHALEAKYLTAMTTLNSPLEAGEKRKQRAGRQFGHADYVAMYDELRGFDLAGLTATMKKFIADTHDLYFSTLDTYLHEMHILREDARRCDLSRIFRAPHHDVSFPSDQMLPRLHSALRDLGILLGDQPNIHVDAEPRPLKSPRAFCAIIGVPDEIRLVVKPSGGEQDYESLFHEAGHAEHYGSVGRTEPFAYRYLGDPSVTESYAFLFEYLLHDANWLRRNLAMDATNFFHLVGFQRLYMLRRYGSKLIYEQELHRSNEPGDVATYYDDLMSQNLGATYGPESFLTDVDDGFYCAAYLRAWIFEAQHRRFLLKEFDQEWFRNPKAGRFLVELWREGQKYSVEELARFMGFEQLDIGVVTQDIRRLLGAE